jgi:hypothetical protein
MHIFLASMEFYAGCCEPASLSVFLSHTLWGMNVVHKCHPLKAVSENITYSLHALDVHAKSAKVRNNYTKYGMNN